jgi:hypothetical protein
MKTRRLFAAAMAAALTFTSSPLAFTTAPQFAGTVYAADTAGTVAAGEVRAITELSQISDTAEADTAAYIITKNSQITSFDRSCTIKSLPDDITIKAGDNDLVVVLDDLDTDKTITVETDTYGTVTFFVKGALKLEKGSKGILCSDCKDGWIIGHTNYIPIDICGEEGFSIELTGGQTVCGNILAPETTVTVGGEGAFTIDYYPDLIYVDPETGEEMHGHVAAPIPSKPQFIGSMLVKKMIGENVTSLVCSGKKPQRPPEYLEQDGLLYSIEGDHAVCHGKAPGNMRTEIEIPENYISSDYQSAKVDGQTVFTAPLKLIPVTEIADDAFRSDAHITSVKIPDTVTRIGKLAFFDCFALEELNVPESVTEIGGGAFLNTLWQDNKQKEFPYLVINDILVDGTPATGRLVLPEGIKHINEYAFERCFNIEEVVIPEGVESIGEGAFNMCNRIGNVVLPASLRSVGKNAFRRDSYSYGRYIEYVTYNGTKDQWKEIDIAEGNTALTVPVEQPDLITHPDRFDLNIITDGDFTYSYNKETKELSLVDVRRTALYKLDIPAEVSIKDLKDFRTYYELKDVDTLPVTKITADNSYDSVKSGDAWPSAFQSCRWVTSVNIPASVKEISRDAFKGCDNLLEIYYGGTESDWDAMTSKPDLRSGVELNFSGSAASEAKYEIVDGVLKKAYGVTGDAVIPDGVTKIAGGVFAGNRNITGVTIPEGVTDIDMCAFQDCISLKTVKLPSTLKNIGRSAFYGCTVLEAPDMPAAVEYVGAGAFDRTHWMNDAWIRRDNAGGDFELVAGHVLVLGKDLEQVTVPGGVTVIAGSAFECNQNTRKITVPEGVTSVGGRAFAEIKSLLNVYLPKSLKRVGDEVFDRDSRNGTDKSINDLGIAYAGTKEDWEKVAVDDMNDGLKAVFINDHFVYGYQTSGRLPEKDYRGFVILPEGITEIPANAFAGNSKITAVVIPDGVTTIGANAFDGCENLTALYIPKSVTKIGAGIIHNCGSFHDMNYAGTDKDWEKIEKGDIHTYGGNENRNDDMLLFDTPYEYVTGDANIDNKINVADAVAVLQYVTNKEKYDLTAQGLRNADTDGEAGITGNDALTIQKIDAGVL